MCSTFLQAFEMQIVLMILFTNVSEIPILREIGRRLLCVCEAFSWLIEIANFIDFIRQMCSMRATTAQS
jgi:hypothetical protein